MATHYGIAVVSARPFKARDKAKVETAVLIVERWILARLRHQQFFSLAQLNQAIQVLLEDLNNRVMKQLQTTRKNLYLTVEKPLLKALPVSLWQYCEWYKARVGYDYHIKIADHYYSVPYRLIKQQLEVRLTDHTLEAFYQGKRVASHARSYEKCGHSTLLEHMPKAHQKHLQWSVVAVKRWATQVGPATEQLVKAIFASKSHPEQGYRCCLGLLNLARHYTITRLENACRYAVAIGSPTYRSVKSILKQSLDQHSDENSQLVVSTHENVRGPAYYGESLITN
ncbi:MAG: IS21 family transposase, partial [Acidobacteriota bacterium]